MILIESNLFFKALVAWGLLLKYSSYVKVDDLPPDFAKIKAVYEMFKEDEISALLGESYKDINEYEAYGQQEYSTVCNQKSQLELYLDEPKLEMSSNLDVLDFWKVNMIRYPDLSVMARDILSIPVSTVASESAFSVGGRVLDRFRSLLKPDIVEAIVCTRDWMEGENVSESLEVDEVVEDILKLTLENSPDPSIESATSQFGD
ncbi:hypothetical protein Ddye_023071 [Dipteronia dyeriana]|uniref:HAT C-terminal dimerisation domain-containing protein n=1 Tax=Dipteronia dyeriana TaxID=168575 RepID=A0AAD9TSW6_9ROSI|nr:hypothetical protein Ddye_023071 [Dipteronia dyeriana]